MAMAGFSLRREAPRVRGRERHAYLDESAALLPGFERRRASLRAKVPRNRAKNTILIASMGLSGMGESVAIKRTTDSEVFEVYVEHFLALRRSERGRSRCSMGSGRTAQRG